MAAPALLPRRPKPRHPLQRWQINYALWYATCPDPPKGEERRAIAEQFKFAAYDEFTADEDKEPLPRRTFYNMEAREDFKALIAKIAEGGLEQARAQLMADMPEYVGMHMWGAKRAKEKDDIKTLATYTGRALDVVAPRKGLDNVAANVITIHIAPAALQAATPVVEAEFIELPPEVHDDTDD